MHNPPSPPHTRNCIYLHLSTLDVKYSQGSRDYSLQYVTVILMKGLSKMICLSNVLFYPLTEMDTPLATPCNIQICEVTCDSFRIVWDMTPEDTARATHFFIDLSRKECRDPNRFKHRVRRPQTACGSVYYLDDIVCLHMTHLA